MTDEAKPTMLDAVNAAMAEMTTPATETATTENDSANTETPVVESADTGASADSTATGGDAGAADGAVDDEGAAGDGEAAGEVDAIDVDENDAAAVAAATADGRVRDPKTGRYVKASEKPAQTAEEKAAADKAAADKAAAEAAAAKKPGDPVNDPIPKELNKKTQERIRALSTMVKTEAEKVAKATQDRDFLLQRVVDSTATPEQYNTLLTVVKFVNSSDPAERKKALEYFQSAAAEMARELGVVVPGVDVLADHADLKQEVELGHISRARAEELAAARNASTYAARTQEQQRVAQREQQQRAVEVNTAKAGLNDLEQTLKLDPNYAAKAKILIPMMQEMFKNVPPAKWVDTFRKAYAQLPAPQAPRPRPVVTAPANQPLRARTGAAGHISGPASLLDAVNAGVAQANAR